MWKHQGASSNFNLRDMNFSGLTNQNIIPDVPETCALVWVVIWTGKMHFRVESLFIDSY